VADAAAQQADATGDEGGAALLRTIAADARLHAGESSVDELERLARTALPLLEGAGDDESLVHVWHALGMVANMHSHFEAWVEAAEQSLAHARRAGRRIHGSFFLSVPLVAGPTPASEALARLESYVADQPHPGDLQMKAVLLAMLGQSDEAWAVGTAAGEKARELGILSGDTWLAEVALIGRDLATTAEYLRKSCDEMERRGATAELSTYAAQLGRVLCMLGDVDEAERQAGLGRELGDVDDVWTQGLWRQALALVHSTRGEHAEAVRLAEEAVVWWSRTDALMRTGEAHGDLAEVLEAAGRREEAIAAWRNALDCYERKQVLPLATSVRERLAALEPASA
jgi:tetratricopeptide (TPR) repeat protein